MFSLPLIIAMAFSATAQPATPAGPAHLRNPLILSAGATAPETPAPPQANPQPHNALTQPAPPPLEPAGQEQPRRHFPFYAIAMTLGPLACVMATALYFQVKKDTARFEREFKGAGP